MAPGDYDLDQRGGNTSTGGVNIVGARSGSRIPDAGTVRLPASPATNIMLNTGQLYNNGGQFETPKRQPQNFHRQHRLDIPTWFRPNGGDDR